MELGCSWLLPEALVVFCEGQVSFFCSLVHAALRPVDALELLQAQRVAIQKDRDPESAGLFGGCCWLAVHGAERYGKPLHVSTGFRK
jgi:hypothetical protein